jgi:hypothetical protein
MRKPTFGVQPAYYRELKEDIYVSCVTMDEALSVGLDQLKKDDEDMSIWKIPVDGKPMLWMRLFVDIEKA